MEYTLKKQYKNFTDFNRDSYNLVEYIRNNSVGMSETMKIAFARNVLTKEILNSFVKVASLSDDIKSIIKSRTNVLLFSMDNMIKNRLSHPEITDEDYTKIPQIVKSPSKYYTSKSGYDVILFKEFNKYYKLVIKTTQNRKENFVKSLHLLNKDRYNKY
ncbi:hypothetical protein IJ579_04005 [bacterium]|nr:hypothetical protein [bacterium]